MLHGEAPTDCFDCKAFDRCHRITVADGLQTIADALSLMVQNGLSDGRLKGFHELVSAATAAGERPSK